PDFFLVVGRARGYKNVETTCEAFARLPEHRLVVVGGLPVRPDGGVWPANLRGVLDVPDSQLRWLYRHCRAVIATSNEDFGLTPLEGNAFGKPALVLRAGGFLDTLVEGVTGFYIDALNVGSVIKAVRLCLEADLDTAKILDHAEHYSMESFITALRREAHEVVFQHRARLLTR
ncbi:MAG: glycosyltransferase, partial [Candidatus Dormibacteria bacterium]